jgi:hypothetical protein
MTDTIGPTGPRRAAAGLVLLLALVSAGCGVRTYPVKGTVTFNGQPIPEGTINFLAEDGRIAPDSGRIFNGEYLVQVKAGRKKVEVYAHREVPGQQNIQVMGLRARESYIPLKYNVRSELRCEVTPQGPNEFNFDLKDDKKR